MYSTFLLKGNLLSSLFSLLCLVDFRPSIFYFQGVSGDRGVSGVSGANGDVVKFGIVYNAF